MMKLDRYKGHFFNWYDTEELLPLKPKVYIVGRQRKPCRPFTHLTPGATWAA